MQPADTWRSFLMRGLLGAAFAFGLWIWLEPSLIASLRVLADLFWPEFIPGGLVRVDPEATAWRIHTGWGIVPAPGEPQYNLIFRLPLSYVSSQLKVMPVLLTLLIASRSLTPTRAAVGLFLAWVAAAASVTLYVWHDACRMQGADGGLGLAGFASLTDRLALPSPAAWQGFVSGIAWRLLTVPTFLGKAVLLWAIVCLPTVRALHGSVWQWRQHRLARKKSVS